MSKKDINYIGEKESGYRNGKFCFSIKLVNELAHLKLNLLRKRKTGRRELWFTQWKEYLLQVQLVVEGLECPYCFCEGLL